MTNIRRWMEEALPQHLNNYSIGLGAAGTRSKHQTRRAREYGYRVIAKCKGGRSYVDGSVYMDTTGGAGVVREDSTGGIHSAFMIPIETKDAQQAELTGIEKAMELMLREEFPTQEYEHIFCDCRNAVNYVRGTFAIPRKYTKTIHRIQSHIFSLRQRGVTVTTHWIPGHADIEGNEWVDQVAKEAARCENKERTKIATMRLRGNWPKEFETSPQRLNTVRKHTLI
jgi:ribonuclease HI